MNKQQLRQLFSAKRSILTSQQLEQVSQAISQMFFKKFDLNKIKCLHLFLPILKKHEINTWFIIQHLREHYPQLTIVVPKIHWSSKEMESYVLVPETQIAENLWGIPEPIEACLFPHQENIDMILLPLLCFDVQGVRVGYGQGFYDRFLKNKCREEVIKVGLGLDEPIDRIEDIHGGDVKMDFCVTDKKIFCFNTEKIP